MLRKPGHLVHVVKKKKEEKRRVWSAKCFYLVLFLRFITFAVCLCVSVILMNRCRGRVFPHSDLLVELWLKREIFESRLRIRSQTLKHKEEGIKGCGHYVLGLLFFTIRRTMMEDSKERGMNGVSTSSTSRHFIIPSGKRGGFCSHISQLYSYTHSINLDLIVFNRWPKGLQEICFCVDLKNTILSWFLK